MKASVVCVYGRIGLLADDNDAIKTEKAGLFPFPMCSPRRPWFEEAELQCHDQLTFLASKRLLFNINVNIRNHCGETKEDV